MTTTANDLLAALRAGGPAAEQARPLVAYTGDRRTDPERAARRAEVAALLAGSLAPTDTTLARWLLTQEIAAHEAAGSGATEALYTLVAVVARYADPADALLIWRAREATPETRAGIDVEQMARAGIDRVRHHLQTLIRSGGAQAEPASHALAWLQHELATGAGSDLPGYFAWSDERFGLHVSGAT